MLKNQINLNSTFQLYTQAKVSEICNEINEMIHILEMKLVPVFNNLDKETKDIERKVYAQNKPEPLYEEDNLENMEQEVEAEIESQEQAWIYYSINQRIQQDFLNITAVWLFHLFEKQRKDIFTFEITGHKTAKELKNNWSKYNKTGDIYSLEINWLLNIIGVPTDDNSNWYKIDTKLRILVNSIKHKNYINKVTFEDTKEYAETIKDFWQEYFYKTESYSKKVDSNYLIREDTMLGKICEDFK